MARLLPFLILAVLGGVFYVAWPSAGPERGGIPEEPMAARAPVPVAVEEEPTEAPVGLPGLDPRTVWLDKNSRALELLEEGEFSAAVTLLEECVAAAEEPTLKKNLAEALVRWAVHLHDVERRFDQAIETLERAIELSPEREDIDVLRRILERWILEASAEEGFWTDDSPYFEVVYDANRDDLRDGVQSVIDELHAAYGDLRDWFVIDPIIDLARPKFRVVLYDAKGFGELTGLGHWAGGVFDGVLRLRVDDLARRRGWKSTLRHELVHAFVREVGGREVPSWLNEGLAQFLDGDGGRSEQRLQHPRTLLKQRLEDGARLFTLEELQASLATWKDTGEITVGYAQSLLLTAHVLDTYGEHTIRQLLTAFREGVAFPEAFRRETGVQARFLLEDLESDLRR